MALAECDTEIEEGSYGDFKFTLRLLYSKKTNEFKHGAVYLRERGDRIVPVELLIEPSPEGLVDLKPLQLAAIKCNYEVRDLEGLLKEISRKFQLVDFLREPESGLPMTARRLLEIYPELKLSKYRERLPEHIKSRIENYLGVRV